MSIALPIIDKVIEQIGKFIPDKTKQMELRASLQAADQQGEFDLALGQMKINQTESQHKSVFVAGWRPAVGWTCCIGLFNHFILTPYFVAFGIAVVAVDITLLTPVLMLMLGARTYEKANGVNNNSLSQPQQLDENGNPVKKKGFFKRIFSSK